MRLTQILLGSRFGRVKGKKNVGKYQWPHIFRFKQRKQFIENLKVECTNEMWLTRPYLSKANEKYVANGFQQKNKNSQIFAKYTEDKHEYNNLRYRIKMRPHVRFEDHWQRLKIDDSWSSYEATPGEPELERYAHAVLPRRYPESWPPPVEKWNEWNKIEGFGKKTPANASHTKSPESPKLRLPEEENTEATQLTKDYDVIEHGSIFRLLKPTLKQ